MTHSAPSMGTLGILGGGQLARMTALAARSMGFRVRALDPHPHCPVAALVDHLTVASFSEVEPLWSFADGCDVVTYDQEHIPPAVLDIVADRALFRPRPDALQLVQDRARQKLWLTDHGFPVGPFEVADDTTSLQAALRAIGPTAHVKSSRGGFDGRGQCVATTSSDPTSVFASLGGKRVIVERTLTLHAELSVMIARRPRGEAVPYPVAWNVHSDGVLAHSVLPAPFPVEVLQRAQAIALDIAQRLNVVGLCAVEMFLLLDGTLLVNEIALRPHNSYHGSDRACQTSQFEQLVRAVFDLPLGPVGLVLPTAMVNLFGDSWMGDEPPDMSRALEVPSVRVHLYDKEARRGRKLGHLTATGADAIEALDKAKAARDALASCKPRAQ